MAYKQKGFTPFTQDKKGLTRYEQYQYYKNKEHITDARKEEQEKRFPTKDFGHIEPKMGYGPAEFIGGPVIKGIQGVKTGVKALKSSPKMQRMLKAWSDKASKAFEAWKKGPGKKMWKKAQDIPTVSSSEFPKGYYKWRGKMYKGTYPKGTEVKGGGRLKWDQHTMKFKNK